MKKRVTTIRTYLSIYQISSLREVTRRRPTGNPFFLHHLRVGFVYGSVICVGLA